MRRAAAMRSEVRMYWCIFGALAGVAVSDHPNGGTEMMVADEAALLAFAAARCTD